MFSKFLLVVLILTSIVLSQTLTKKGTASFWLKNNFDTQDSLYVYNNASTGICTVSIAYNSMKEIKCADSTSLNLFTIYAAGTKCNSINTGDVIIVQKTIPYIVKSSDKYIRFWIKNTTINDLWFHYTRPTFSDSIQDSINVLAHNTAEVTCAKSNNTVSCFTSKALSVSSVSLGDLITCSASSMTKSTNYYISFWIKNNAVTSKIFSYKDADNLSQSITVLANSDTEVNYVRPLSAVSTSGAAAYNNLQRGDLITYNPGTAVEVSPNVKSLSFENVNVDIFNLKGQRVAKDVRLASIRGLRLTSGLYIAKVELASNVYSKRILITK